MSTSGDVISGLFLVDVDRGRLEGGEFAAALPDDKDDIDVAEGHEESGNDEYVGREEGEVELALPPGRVASTGTLVLDHALRVHAHRHLHENETLPHSHVLILCNRITRLHRILWTFKCHTQKYTTLLNCYKTARCVDDDSLNIDKTDHKVHKVMLKSGKLFFLSLYIVKKPTAVI